MILDELAAHARERVAADKAKISLEDMKAQAEALPKGDFRFEKALSGKECAFICEVKKASPSKGIIDPVFDFEKIAQSYEDAGADCVSCLTEPKWFLGSDEIFKKVRGIVTRPMIRKDFTVDEYQIYQAKVLGADAVLLICTLLDTETIRDYIGICDKLGISALVETVVLLSHKKPDSYIHIDVEFGEGEGKIPVDKIVQRAEQYKPKERVTYKRIKEYILEKYGFKVHTAYIAEVKRSLGLPMYDAPNAVEKLKQARKHPTPEKVEAIKDALHYFAVI